MTTRPRSPPRTPAPASSRCPSSREMKRRGERIVMVTAYDSRAAASPTPPAST